MKKKILLVLLVVLMVGILAFSVFACNKNKGKDPVKPNTPVTPDEPGIDDTDYLGEALGAVVTAIDNTLANVNDIDTAASVSADIVVKVAVGTETYDVSLKVKGSIDENAPAKNWAQIDADVLGVKVSLFAMNDGNKETLYVAQNVLNEDVKWNKLSQFEQANVLSDLACGSILDLVKGIDDKTADSLEAGLVNGYAGQILPMVGMVGSLFQPAEGAGKDFATESGYGIGLNIDELGQLLPTILKLIGGLDLGDATGLVNTIGGIVLGGTLDLGAGSFEPGEHVPTVEIGVGIENELFTGLSLKYAGKIALEEGAEPTDIAINFGIENLSLSGASKAYTKPFTGTPDELAIALNLGLDLPEGVYAGNVDVAVNVYPNVAMTFDEDGYVALDLSGLYGYATATLTPDEITEYNEVQKYTVAEYNVSEEYPDDIIIDLSAIYQGLNLNVATTQFRIPFDLQAKFDAMIAEQKAPKTEGEAQNAIEGNVVDHVIDNIIPTLFDEQGNFQIGALLGVVGQLGDIVDAITPILETEGLFSYELGEDEATASATLNIEVLMDALLADNGIIDGITGDWNNFSLYNADGEKVEGMKLADILAPDAVFGNIIALANTLIYENYVENFVPATEGEEALSYADYFASEDAVVEVTESAILMALNSGLGLNIDTTDLYKNMTVSVNGYAQNGIGFGIGATVGNDSHAIGISLGLEIIENVAKASYTSDIYYTGDVTGIAKDQYGQIIEGAVRSNCTGNDGGAWLKDNLLMALNSAIWVITNWIDIPSGLAIPGESYEAPAQGFGTYQLPSAMFGAGLFFVEVTTEGPATIKISAEVNQLEAGGLVESYDDMNFMRPITWAGTIPAIGPVGEDSALVTSASVSVAEAGTYVFAFQYYGNGTATIELA